MQNGYIKLHRTLINWEWYTEPNVVLFFIHCLLRANHKDGTWKGQTVLKGQFISGRKALSAETGLSERNVRTCIGKLIKSGELTIKTTNKNTVFTLNNWIKYQDNDSADQQSANKRPANDQQTTTNKNEKNEKNVNKYTIDYSEIEFLNVEAWKSWIDYKKEIKSKYKTKNGEMQQIKELLKISGNDKDLQRQIILQSINKEWKGLFPLKKAEEKKQWSLF